MTDTKQHSRAEDEVLVRVEGVSKKFCRSLKRSLWYGRPEAAVASNWYRVTGNSMSFAESFEDLKVWQRARTLRASHPDNDRAGDFLLKNLEATREESSSRGLASSLPPTISET